MQDTGVNRPTKPDLCDCIFCNKELPFTEEFFGVNRHNKWGLSYKCKSCVRDYVKLHRKENPELYKALHRKKQLEIYGLSLEEYQSRLDRQLGICLLCQGPETLPRREVLCVDHCHKTGIIRGLLCHKCNTLLALVERSPNILDRIKPYLEGKL